MSKARELKEENLDVQAMEVEDEAYNLGLPADIMNKIVTANEDYNSFKTTQMMAKWSNTCTVFDKFFKSELDGRKQQAKQLLIAVLHGDADEVLRIAQTHPELFFIKIHEKVKDYAMDLDGNCREMEGWSAYQAIFGTGDKEMLVDINDNPTEIKKCLDAYLDTLSDGCQFASDHVREKFPDGLDYPESTYDFDPIAQAITNDRQLKGGGQPSKETLAALEKFRADFKPSVIRSGHHFNMNDFIKAWEVDKQNYDPWTARQILFYRTMAIGFLERLLTAPYQMRADQGLQHRDRPIRRSFEIVNCANHQKMVPVYPLDSDPACILGRDFFVECYFGLCVERRGYSILLPMCARVAGGWRHLFGQLCQANTAVLSGLIHTEPDQRPARVNL